MLYHISKIRFRIRIADIDSEIPTQNVIGKKAILQCEGMPEQRLFSGKQEKHLPLIGYT